MRILRYEDDQGRIRYAEDRPNEGQFRLEGDPFNGLVRTAEAVQVTQPLAPVDPPAIFCIGLNYRRHAEETKAQIPSHPVLFMKSPAAVQHPGRPIEIPRHLASERVDYEVELAVVIGRRCKNVSSAEALSYVLGYTAGNDVSARDWQIKYGGTQWCRGKTFDTFAPLGPYLVTLDEFPDPGDLRVRTILNGETVQDSRTSDMIFSVSELVAFLSGSTTLLPGTVIFTGTPEGVGMAADPPRWLRPGDVVTVDVEGVGALTNPVRLEPL